MTRLVMHKMSTHSMSEVARQWFQNHGRQARRRRAEERRLAKLERALEREAEDSNWLLISQFGEEDILDGYGDKGAINRRTS